MIFKSFHVAHLCPYFDLLNPGSNDCTSKKITERNKISQPGSSLIILFPEPKKGVKQSNN
jgi:hypothetical protein